MIILTLKFAWVQYLHITVWFSFTELFAILLLSKSCINLCYTPVVRLMNSRGTWLKRLGSYCNYLSMATNGLQRVPWDFFIFPGSIPLLSRTFCYKCNCSLSRQLVIHKRFLRCQFEKVCTIFFYLLSAIKLGDTKVLSSSHIFSS